MHDVPYIEVQDISIGYGCHVVQQNLNFTLNKNDVFFIIGGSGCGKTTLLKDMIGLIPPTKGRVLYEGVDFYGTDEKTRLELLKSWGVTYQSGALFSSMTLAENVSLPMQLYTDWSKKQITEAVAYKLALVGLAGFESFYPSEVSGGMHKRAGLARAIALDPQLLFFDEPSAGLDPISSMRLDQLIQQICVALDSTVIIVSPELPSILSIGTNCVVLDAQSKTMLDAGDPQYLLEHSSKAQVRHFLSRSDTATSEKV